MTMSGGTVRPIFSLRKRIMAIADSGPSSLTPAKTEAGNRARHHRVGAVLVVDPGHAQDPPFALAPLDPVIHADVPGEVEEVAVEPVAHQHHRVGLEERAVALEPDPRIAEPMLAALIGRRSALIAMVRSRKGAAGPELPRHVDRRVGMEAGAHRLPFAMVRAKAQVRRTRATAYSSMSCSLVMPTPRLLFRAAPC